MTHFKQGGVYVGEKTGVVIEIQRDDIDNNRLIGVIISHPPHQKRFNHDLRYYWDFATGPDNPDKSYLLSLDELEGIEPLRPWKPSDEPAFWGDKYDFGDIEIGKVYKGVRESGAIKSFHTLIATIKSDGGNEVASVFQWRGLEPAYRINYYKEFLTQITRPAFPHEIEGLILPQTSGVI